MLGVSVALDMLDAMYMRRIVLSMALLYFSTSSHKRYDIRKISLLNINRVFDFFYNMLSETFLILRRTERDMIINVHRS